MKTLRLAFQILAPLASLLFSQPASAWGCMGHQVVAALAYRELTQHARAESDRTLSDLSAYQGISHFCGTPNVPAFVLVSTWADDIRKLKPETGPWHFIDIPLSATPDQYASYCDPQAGCVVSQIKRTAAALSDPSVAADKRTDALVFLIHLVGDVHQPLHNETNNDRGGNCFPITYFGKPPKEGTNESFTLNLHGIWDTELVERLVDLHGGPKNFVVYLERQYRGLRPGWASDLNPMDWAADGHRKAATIAYQDLPVFVQIEQPVPVSQCSDDNHVSHRLEALDAQLADGYAAMVSPTIEVQLASAGTRLAAILNRIWP